MTHRASGQASQIHQWFAFDVAIVPVPLWLVSHASCLNVNRNGLLPLEAGPQGPSQHCQEGPIRHQNPAYGFGQTPEVLEALSQHGATACDHGAIVSS